MSGRYVYSSRIIPPDEVIYRVSDPGSTERSVLMIIIITLVILVVVWVIYLTIRNESPEENIAVVGTFLSKCDEDNPCGTGLACDFGTCKIVLGEPCKLISDCVSEANSCAMENENEMVCSELQIGVVNGVPPCDQGLIEVDGRCKLSEGMSCALDFDCATNICFNGVCSGKLPEGSNCKPGQCQLGLECVLGICANAETIQQNIEDQQMEVEEYDESETQNFEIINGKLYHKATGKMVHNGMNECSFMISFVEEDNHIIIIFNNHIEISYNIVFIEDYPFLVEEL